MEKIIWRRREDEEYVSISGKKDGITLRRSCLNVKQRQTTDDDMKESIRNEFRKMSNRRYLKDGDCVFATGVFLVYENGKWVEDGFEGDTFFEGLCVEDIEDKPYIEREV